MKNICHPLEEEIFLGGGQAETVCSNPVVAMGGHSDFLEWLGMVKNPPQTPLSHMSPFGSTLGTSMGAWGFDMFPF